MSGCPKRYGIDRAIFTNHTKFHKFRESKSISTIHVSIRKIRVKFTANPY